MRIAIMMSTYNGEKYLDAQLASLAAQTVADSVTLYIRDDGSKDQTFEIIDKWKDKLSIVLLQGENLGPAKSFWALLEDEQIQADYYAFCDQDDVWDADKLEISVSRLEKDGAQLYACNSRLIDGNGDLLEEEYTKRAPEISIPRLFVAGVAQGCAMLFTDSLRQFIVSKKIQCIPMHDVIVMLYALGYGTVIWDHQTHFGYRAHSNNVVARENKSILKRIRSTYWNWRNSGKNSMSTVAQEMLANAAHLSDADVAYLTNMSNYRKSLSAKLKLFFQKQTDIIPFRVMRSYRLRLLLNLL